MNHKVTLILGDGTGPEIASAAKQVIDSTGVKIDWDEQEAGIDVFEETGEALPKKAIDSIKKNKVALKAPITTPVGEGFRSVNVALRQELDLYACLRPCKLYDGVRSNFKKVDLVIVRENIEDLYAGIEFQKGEQSTRELIEFIAQKNGKKILLDSGISIKPISITNTERIVRFAFEYAKKHNRKKVTAVHKANIMKFSDGLFLETARKAAQRYPEIAFEDVIVDNMCMQLVQKPELYDVLVLPNLYGDILSDLAAGLIGGLGVAPGGNIGTNYAVFEATHGSAPKYKGLNKVNPTALLLSGVMMLHHIGETEAANKMEKAIAEVIKEGKSVTYDMKQNRDDPSAVGTIEMAHEIMKKMEKM